MLLVIGFYLETGDFALRPSMAVLRVLTSSWELFKMVSKKFSLAENSALISARSLARLEILMLWLVVVLLLGETLLAGHG